MAQTFLAIGECMIELSPQDGNSLTVGFAGDTFNTAWYARRLAAPDALSVSYFTALGDDEMSSRMIRFMEEAGITPNIAEIEGASPGLYMIFLEEGERHFQYWRSQSAARQLASHLDRLPALRSGDLVYFSGITMAILPETGRQSLLARLRGLSETGVRIAFDPNLRPKLWNTAADMIRWTTEAAAAAEIILPSYADEADHFGDLAPEDTAKRYLDNGSAIAVVKDGSGPVTVRTAGRFAFQYHPESLDTVVDTTAAGDSFNAGFLVEYLSGSGLHHAVGTGCRVSRQVISNRGALVPVSLSGTVGDAAKVPG
ncbi:sugar kinase [Roseibium sp. RKSG952]|uniref:sugar kinase n=1 Tax=Roseibium sp. RKSG952 TaxID=2529384 RepID=UPI0012BCAD15|nr:sugar kinase [Roseibium sp. RKSG952]MTH99552.1 sugar kinase [Roseibium sp. RKSG952]